MPGGNNNTFTAANNHMTLNNQSAILGAIEEEKVGAREMSFDQQSDEKRTDGMITIKTDDIRQQAMKILETYNTRLKKTGQNQF